jgi:lactate dehydrogenase-like 2-hydroxyacid dehydrogenase
MSKSGERLGKDLVCPRDGSRYREDERAASRRWLKMDVRGKKVVVIGGAGLIGSHTGRSLVREDVKEIVIYDNFVRGTHENLAEA